MKDSQRYFESRAINEEDTSDKQKVGGSTVLNFSNTTITL